MNDIFDPATRERILELLKLIRIYIINDDLVEVNRYYRELAEIFENLGW